MNINAQSNCLKIDDNEKKYPLSPFGGLLIGYMEGEVLQSKTSAIKPSRQRYVVLQFFNERLQNDMYPNQEPTAGILSSQSLEAEF